jgi:hypothetical protein
MRLQAVTRLLNRIGANQVLTFGDCSVLNLDVIFKVFELTRPTRKCIKPGSKAGYMFRKYIIGERSIRAVMFAECSVRFCFFYRGILNEKSESIGKDN